MLVRTIDTHLCSWISQSRSKNSSIKPTSCDVLRRLRRSINENRLTLEKNKKRGEKGRGDTYESKGVGKKKHGSYRNASAIILTFYFLASDDMIMDFIRGPIFTTGGRA